MRRHSKPPVSVACLSLLFLQLSGTHVHADEGGYIGVPATPFLHSHIHHDHHDAHQAGDGEAGHGSEHGEARDISLLDLALSLFKMPLAMLALLLLFALFPSIKSCARFDFVYRVLSGRHTRWRPPLRAPPQAA